MFSVVLCLTTPGYNYPQAVEYAVSGYCSSATASAGQSYYSSAGSQWYDLTAYDDTANFCIKAYLPQDQTLPSVTVNQAAGQADPTNGAPILFTALFSEAVTNFATGDVTVSGTAAGTKTATVSGSGSNYTIAVTGMTGDGTVSVSISAGVATDLVGNPNTASTGADNVVTYDATAPTVRINQAAGQADPTNLVPICFAAVFSEAVTNFVTGDVTISGTAPGNKTAAVSGSGSNYTISVSGMTNSGTVVASIAAGAATDLAGNANAASTSTDNSVTYQAVTARGTPYPWLDAYRLVSSGNYAVAEAADADGDGYTAWQEYVAGTNPTNAASVFLTLFGLSNGLPVVTWTPNLGTARVYTIEGKASLTNAAWAAPTNAATRFFRVRVSAE
jgi:hypothetical protein